MHFYIIPELRDTDNEIIKTNAIYLIDNNLVRGGIDDDGSHTFPWIRRITSSGIRLMEKLADESSSDVPELQDVQNDKIEKQDMILRFISYCAKTDVLPGKVLEIAKNVGL